jgi:hypothetical protein
MRRVFAVIRARGPGWDAALPLEQQPGWDDHARFMDALYEEGFVVLVGPLEGTRDALLIVRAGGEAEIEARLAEDPWSGRMLVVTRIAPWQIRLGSLDRAGHGDAVGPSQAG